MAKANIKANTKTSTKLKASENTKQSAKANTQSSRRPHKKLKVIPLGGLREIGKNMTLLEYGDDIIAIDCGMMFPGSEQYGIDAVIPDFTYLTENAGKFRGVIITHAHEDHIGGVPYLLRQFDVPIYGSRLSIGFINNKLKEFKIQKPKLIEIEAGNRFKLGCFVVEPIHTTHSVSDSFAFLIETPVGKIFHTGDFKVDYTPVNSKPIDLGRIAQIGDEGVHLLLAESTNAMRKGYTPSERTVGVSLGNIFAQTPHRIIIATFSSNVDRIQRIIDLAVANGRKVAVSGRSMENTIKIAQELGYLDIPANTLITLKQIKQFNDSKIVIITTGSQGEPMSALSRIAAGGHRDINVRKDDVIILSSSPVPGNEKDVYNLINTLMAKGANVIYNDIAETHVSGHACQEELKLMHTLLKPKFFMPVHGEVRHLISHARIAENLGMPSKNIIYAANGSVVEMTRDKVKLSSEEVSGADVLVDGFGVGDVGSAVLNERKVLSESGVVVLSAVFDAATGEMINGPLIKTKGLIFVKEYGQMLKDAEAEVLDAVSVAAKDRKKRAAVEKIMVDTLKKYIYKKINRDPVIVTVFMEV